MRKLEAAVTAQAMGDGLRLRLRTATGEEIFTDLLADPAAALRDTINAVLPRRRGKPAS